MHNNIEMLHPMYNPIPAPRALRPAARACAGVWFKGVDHPFNVYNLSANMTAQVVQKVEGASEKGLA